MQTIIVSPEIMVAPMENAKIVETLKNTLIRHQRLVDSIIKSTRLVPSFEIPNWYVVVVINEILNGESHSVLPLELMRRTIKSNYPMEDFEFNRAYFNTACNMVRGIVSGSNLTGIS